jgi:hypothetical protein
MTRETKYRIFLTLTALASLVFVLAVTWKFGAGVSSDAVRNLAAADSLLAGKGFLGPLGEPFVYWPPLYPLLLAGLGWLTGLDPFAVAGYLNAALYAVNTWLWGWLFYLTFRERPTYAVLGTLAVFFSRSMLVVYANVASEPLFMTFMILFFMAAAAYLKDASPQARWLTFAMAGLAMLQRHPGVALFLVGGIVVLKRESWRGAVRALPSTLACIAPAISWALFHTLPLSGGLFGARRYETMLPLENMRMTLTKMVHWFFPYLRPLEALFEHPWLVAFGLVVILAVFNRRKDWLAWARAIYQNEYFWPSGLFSLVYFLIMAFSVVTADHRGLSSDRYYIILLPCLLALSFITLEHLVLAHIKSPAKWTAFTALFALWMVYPMYGVGEYLNLARTEGESSGLNFQNSRYFQELPAKQIVQDLIDGDPDAVVYSNYANVVWFYYRPHPIDSLPVRPEDLSLEEAYSGWPGEADGYILWFTPNEYLHIASPDELSSLATLELLFTDDDTQVYRVTPKPRKESIQ